MRVVLGVLQVAVLLFILVLFARLILDWVQVFARDWRPRGAALVVAEAVYTVTDPPLRWLRRIIPPLSLGSIRLDLGFMVLVLGCWFLLSMLGFLAAGL
ncbi:YggT family protein [Cellulomonas denverensis]|uniref:YggT family protein n=1 Tax=Cellulomonas denverensis TaxID=264297 RepID=A0A7X6KX77_9CELL|nr:YggT family protein [Cellulomonas denverensis]NKY23852.1 YggT family protein [Cellulomonas denverensis]GIG25140.1 YggT family protein [Cellulomonas denverensis]